MDGNSWRQAAPAPAPSDPAGAGVGADPAGGDWRLQLMPEARQRIVNNKIMDTLKRHLPISMSPEGLNELKKIAVRFEEKIYTAATNQSDYLRQISLKMVSIQKKTQGTAAINPSLSNPVVGYQNSSESAPMDSITQTGHGGMGDWQEEIYQKVKSMKDLYFAEINELHQKISLKIQQTEAFGPPTKQSDQFEKLKQVKQMLERTIMFLQLSKNSIQSNLKEKLPRYEKLIVSFVASNRGKKAPSQQQGQQQFAHPSSQAHSVPRDDDTARYVREVCARSAATQAENLNLRQRIRELEIKELDDEADRVQQEQAAQEGTEDEREDEALL